LKPKLPQTLQRHPSEQLDHLPLQRQLEPLEVSLGLPGDEHPRPQVNAQPEAPQIVAAQRIEGEGHALAPTRDVHSDHVVVLEFLSGGHMCSIPQMRDSGKSAMGRGLGSIPVSLPLLPASYLALLALLLCMVACAVPVRHSKFIAAVPYATAPLPPRTKIFLVAGGVEVANFAEEVVAQRKLWLARGFEPDEIACYWSHPRRADLRGDLKQYRDLADDLRRCYPAATALLRRHLQQQAAQDLPFLYIYVTSHGNADILPVDVPLEQLSPAERDLFDQYVVQLGAGIGRGVSPSALARELRGGADPRDLAFSPAVLRELLQALPPTTPKFVVLQACHSGGFLVPDAIAGVSHLTAIAAARHDRTSFGCDAGAEFTYFGAVYLRRLLDMPGPPPALDWPALFALIRADVDLLERKVDVRRSLPVFVQTQ